MGLDKWPVGGAQKCFNVYSAGVLVRKRWSHASTGGSQDQSAASDRCDVVKCHFKCDAGR